MGKKTRFPEIRAELRAREAHSKTIGERIRATAGTERMRFWEMKRHYGRSTRAVLLAYAFLRGKPRRKSEATYNLEFHWTLSWEIHMEAKRLGHELELSALRAWMLATPEAAPAVTDEQAVPDSAE